MKINKRIVETLRRALQSAKKGPGRALQGEENGWSEYEQLFVDTWIVAPLERALGEIGSSPKLTPLQTRVLCAAALRSDGRVRNFGQRAMESTRDMLAAGYVEKKVADAGPQKAGHVYYVITEAGRKAVSKKKG